MEEVILKIVTPKVSYGPYECDSIHLTVCDNESSSANRIKITQTVRKK